MPNGYNKGDRYEEKILRICINKGITRKNFKRGGAGNSADIEFIHNGKTNVLEVKADTKADYGQKMLHWENNIWTWCVNDDVTRLYTELGILSLIQNKDFVPKRYTIQKELITLADKKFDQNAFEQLIDIGTEKLFLYYDQKNCHYIQIGGYGFYYLNDDILNLGVPQFDGKLKLRFRAKTIHSSPMWKYGFYAVLKISVPPKESQFDIEELNNRVFPLINP